MTFSGCVPARGFPACRVWLALGALAAAAGPAAGQDPDGEREPAGPGVDYRTARSTRRLVAVRTNAPITIDGRLDEEAWARAAVARDFLQSEPREGEAASEPTEVRVLYDADHLYVGVFAADSDTGGVIVNELEKDFSKGQTDAFEVVLDTFRDERNGYQFAVNPGARSGTRRWRTRGARATSTGTASGRSAR